MVVQILQGDVRVVLPTLPAESVHCVVTSPPYWGLRDYGVDDQIGLEPTVDDYIDEMVRVFREVRRVLRGDGTLWLNLGDAYATGAGRVGNSLGGGEQGARWAERGPQTGLNRLPIRGLKPKDLIGMPWRVAFALQADGWWLRQDIIWSKPNPMPESVTDRCTKAHEYLYLLSKSERYFFDAVAIREAASYAGWDKGCDGRRDKETVAARPPQSGSRGLAHRDCRQLGRNKRSVWEIATEPFGEAHFATFPTNLVEPCILAGCPNGGTVLDPFGGAGTTGLVADRLGRDATLIEINPAYVEMALRRLHGDAPLLVRVERSGDHKTVLP